MEAPLNAVDDGHYKCEGILNPILHAKTKRMVRINIKKSEALEVPSMKIQYDVRWNRHIFSVLWCFLFYQKR